MTAATFILIHKQPQDAGAAAIGAEFVNLGAEDEYLFDTPELRNSLTAVLRRAKADAVLAPSPTCYQTDHTIASEITFQATHLAALPQLRIDEPALPRAPATYYYDTVLGLDFEPSFFIDVTDVFERKLELARLHVSQMASMNSQSGWDLVEGISKPIVEKGFINVPEAPGLGITLNEEVVRQHLLEGRYFEPTTEWDDERSGDRLWS